MNKNKVRTVMREFKSGDLKSSSGKKVINPKQAIAIALSEAGKSKPKLKEGGHMKEPKVRRAYAQAAIKGAQEAASEMMKKGVSSKDLKSSSGKSVGVRIGRTELLPVEKLFRGKVTNPMAETGMKKGGKAKKMAGGGPTAGPKKDETKGPEFKEWFGKSKIVDDEGKPKVMYHGTARDIKMKKGGMTKMKKGGYC